MDGVTGLGWAFIFGGILLTAFAIVSPTCFLVGGLCGLLMPRLSIWRGLVCGLVAAIPLMVAFTTLPYLWDSALGLVVRGWLFGLALDLWAVGVTSGLCYWWANRRSEAS